MLNSNFRGFSLYLNHNKLLPRVNLILTKLTFQVTTFFRGLVFHEY